ncbi:MAG: prolyl aminopeptidase [Methylococcales bacterium]|nr:prolyl aminopeptidase [Methylococcales bacterium]
MKSLYPQIEPFHRFFLQTDGSHSVYVEQSGNPQGIPVIFLHGGPCSGTKPDHRRFFNPQKYHIILMDQRGCGQSLPFGEIENNTTQDLIDDMERIRQQLNIKQWLLFGGSWGSALTLLYAQQHKAAVLGMVIRGVFLARQMDLDWFAKDGAGRIYPETWQQLQASVYVSEKAELVKDLYDAVFGDDELTKRRAAKAWINWGGQVALMQDYQAPNKPTHVTEKMVQQVQMEMHYAQNKYFIAENQILDHSKDLQDIPTVIVHGRCDLVCPIEAGLSLSKALPNAEFIVLPNAGHIASGEEMIDALVDAADNMLELIQ